MNKLLLIGLIIAGWSICSVVCVSNSDADRVYVNNIKYSQVNIFSSVTLKALDLVVIPSFGKMEIEKLAEIQLI